MTTARTKEVAVIGGGAGGCCTALCLARNQNIIVNIFEKDSELMRGSSDATPGRMGLGFHYADEATAIHYLHATLEFTRRFGHFRQEVNRESTHPLRRGRYFIMKDSLVPREKILQTYDRIKDEYNRLVTKDKRLLLFGPPEDFYRIMEPCEYEDQVDISKVDIGIETAEELLDWASFRSYIIEEMNKNQNITIRVSTEVLNISKLNKGYCINYETSEGSIEIFKSNAVVNSAWYNIPKLNKMLNISDVKRCNRVKAIASVRLPEDLVDAPSMFFCMGSFCMFSNKGQGIGMLTYASKTNVAISSSSDFENEMKDVFFQISENERTRKGQNIIDGVSQFIPKMKNAQLINTRFGVIQTLLDTDTIDYGFRIGNLDFIHDPKRGGIYKRDYSGVSSPCPGYVINACIKLLYCFRNAETVCNIIEEQGQSFGQYIERSG